MPKFDVKAARAEGYTDAEIAAYLAQQSNFDLDAALKEGYTPQEVVAHLAGPVVAPPARVQPDNSASQWAGVLSRAVAPYLTAGAAGAAAGAPLAGVGAIPGAAGGVLALGAGDIGTSLYNAAAPVWGGQRVPLPSETIQNQFVNLGLASNPQTAEQRVAGDIASGLAGGIAQPAAFAQQASRVVSPTMQRIMNVLAEQRRAQAGAGAGAAALPSVAQNYLGVNDPAALFGLSLAGGMVGGKRAAARPEKITPEQAARRSTAAYDAAKQAGVNVSAAAMGDLKANIDALLANTDYDAAFHPLVKRAAAMFEAKANDPMSFQKLEAFRRAVRDLPYSEAGGAAGTKTERAMVGQMADTINDFMLNLTPSQTTAGNIADATAYLPAARDLAKRNFEADMLSMAADKARRKATGSLASNLQLEFNKVAGNPRRMGALSPETQNFVNAMAEGKGGLGALTTLGKAAPHLNWPTIVMGLGGGAAGMTQGYTLPVVGGAVLGGGALASKGLANRMAGRRVAGMANELRGGTNFQTPTPQIMAQALPQAAKQLGFPEIDPETGAPLVGIGQVYGQYFPQYGEPTPRQPLRVTITPQRGR